MAAADDYERRAAQFGLAPKAEVADLAKTEGVVWLDVRSQGEVDNESLPTSFIHIPVTVADTSGIDTQAREKIPADAKAILCFCGVGGRVQGAKAALERLGFTNVVNCGGLKDVLPLFE